MWRDPERRSTATVSEWRTEAKRMVGGQAPRKTAHIVPGAWVFRNLTIRIT